LKRLSPSGAIAGRVQPIGDLPKRLLLGAQQIRQHGCLLIRGVLAGIAPHGGLPLLGNGWGHILRIAQLKAARLLGGQSIFRAFGNGLSF
jgi:hypothetical protein